MRTYRAGVSLIEMLIVFAVLGVTLGIGMPRFQGMIDRSNVSSARDQVMTALNTARTTALRRGAAATFNISGNSLWVTADSSGTQVAVFPKVFLDDLHGVTVKTAGNTSKIVYNMRGIASDASGRIYVGRGSKLDSVCVTALGGTTRLACP